MSRTARIGQVILVLLGVLSAVIAVSVYAPVDDPFESDAQALIASYGVAFGVLVVVLAIRGLPTGQWWPWLSLWILPAFLVSHIALLGTVVPDAVFAVLAVAALWLTRPSRPVPAAGSEAQDAPRVTARN